MLNLSEENIFLNCRAPSKKEAIKIAADALIQSGFAKTGFFEAMMAREKSVSTYLGAGVALPHCAKENIDLVIKTGFHLFQFPQGVSWGAGKVAFVVVAVAAKHNEHLQVLADIADLLGDELKTTLLAQATRKNDFIEQFEKQ
ncbi:PTS sugar transporter subunit IIA [Nissabacter archeti]|uniref:PTS sugar transporter subunit IIA n=1 Tax=Nissabacter archeti TaxID=1917880 RepID=A0ABS5JHL2_9GAMM|nr:PTS sugar transporter subunit IIA [Nissabacter archeti]MBS0969430.1 PTS sugar transporter subunit IIA [Nissabacter archeti]